MSTHTLSRILPFLSISLVVLLARPYGAHAALLQTQWASSCPAGWTATELSDMPGATIHALEAVNVVADVISPPFDYLCVKSDEPALTISSEWNTGGACSAGFTFAQLYDDLGAATGDLFSLHNLAETINTPVGSSANQWCLAATAPAPASISARWATAAKGNPDGGGPACAADETKVIDGKGLVRNLNVSSGVSYGSLCIKIANDGACGSANGVGVAAAPSTNLCSIGTASAVSGSGPWTWSCGGTNGGANASCSAPQVANIAPNAPSISGPTTGKNTISYSYSFTATDPDGETIRYGVDWDHDNTVDEWVPAASYVASGVATSTGHSWNTIGTKNIQVLTQDVKGTSSGWTQYSITISTLSHPPVALITVSPGSIASGNSSTITYTCSNGTSASITPTPGAVTPATGGTTVVSPSVTTVYILTCANSIGTTTSQETITVSKPNLQAYDITTLDTLVAGSAINWRLYVTNELPPAANSFMTTLYICPKADSACSAAAFALQSGSLWGKILAFITVHTAYAATYPVILVSSNMSLAGESWNWVGVTSGTTDFGSLGGQFNLIACADNNGSKVGTVAETYENDNCFDKTFTILPPAPGVGACTATPTVLPDTGGVVTYDADPSVMTDPPYSWVSSDGQGGPFGSNRTTTRTFTSTDKNNPYGMTVTPDGSDPRECPVVVVGTVCGGAPTGTLSATPARVRSGTAPNLSVGIVSHVPIGETCVVTGPGYTSNTIPSNNCSTDPVTPLTPTPPAITTQTVYKLMCDGIQADDLIVNVIPAFKEF